MAPPWAGLQPLWVGDCLWDAVLLSHNGVSVPPLAPLCPITRDFFLSYILSYSMSGTLRHLDTGCTINLRFLLLRIAINELVIFSHAAARQRAESAGQLHLI